MASESVAGDSVAGQEPQKRPNPMRGRVASNGDTPASYGNIANIITVVRILLAPVFMWLLLADNGEYGLLRWRVLIGKAKVPQPFRNSLYDHRRR